MVTIRSTGWLGAAVAALVLGLSACGGDEPPPQPPPQPTPQPIETTPPPAVTDTGDAVLEGDRIKIAKTIYYDTDKDTIRPESYPILNAVANVIKSHPEIEQLIVEGHTDDQGNVEHNRELSEKRANAVVRYLASVGITIPMQAPGYGATAPVCFTTDDTCRQMNRRVEFKVKRKQ
jgi:outer membrane protein OmpA-like peptidoglycan-associated protein